MSSTKKVAIITGASQGIGAALVTAYRKLGYAVVATSRSIDPSDDPDVLTVPADVAEPGVGAISSMRLWTASAGRHRRQQCRIYIGKPFTDYTDQDYDAVTGVNLRGFFEVSRSAVAAMLSRDGGGHLVNVSTSLVDHANSGSRRRSRR